MPWECVGADPVQSSRQPRVGPEFHGERGALSAFTFGREPDWGFLLTVPFSGGRSNTEKRMLELQGKTEYSLPEEHRTHL